MYVNQAIESPVKEFQNRRFILQKQIGFGTEGVVFEAKVENQTFYQTNVAIKLYKDIKPEETQFIDWILEWQKQYEVESMSFLVKIFELIKYNKQTYVVMELGQCSLKQFLDENTLSYDKQMDICLQISKSIQFLHNHNYLHRDIKSENFVKFQNQFKLTDFGSIKKYDVVTQQRLNTVVGTLQYQAPEIQDQKYSQEIDIWSLGCIFYEVFQNKEFFQGRNLKETLKNQKEYLENREKYLEKLNFSNIEIPIEWKNLMIKMLDKIVENRPIIKEIVDEITNIQIQVTTKQNIVKDLQQKDNFHQIYFYQEKQIIAVKEIDIINQEVINRGQHNNKIDPPSHTDNQQNDCIFNSQQ